MKAGTKIKNRGLGHAVLLSARTAFKGHTFQAKDILTYVSSSFAGITEKEVGNSLCLLTRNGKLRRVGNGKSGTFENRRSAPTAKDPEINGEDLLDEALDALVVVEQFVKEYKALRARFEKLKAALT